MIKKIPEKIFEPLTIISCFLGGIILTVFLGLFLSFILEFLGVDTKAVTTKEIIAWSAMW